MRPSPWRRERAIGHGLPVRLVVVGLGRDDHQCVLQNAAPPSNFLRQYEGRNAFHQWIRTSIAQGKPIKDICYEALTLTGNNFNSGTGGANFALNGITPMGPIQDTYDTMLSKAASAFLGLSHYDCLLCHNGRGHLDQVNLWGSRQTRAQAQGMAFGGRSLATVLTQQSWPRATNSAWMRGLP
jgi:hypothetical protein